MKQFFFASFIFLFASVALGADVSKAAFPYEVQYDEQGNAKYFKQSDKGLVSVSPTVFNRVLDAYVADAKKIGCRLKPAEIEVHIAALNTVLVWDTSLVCK